MPQAKYDRIFTCACVGAAVAIGPGVAPSASRGIGTPMHAQSNLEEVMALDLPSGRANGTLRLPSTKTSRPPAVYLVTDAKTAADLAEALAPLGVATLRQAAGPDAAPIDPDIGAQWVTRLRNDARFPVVVVYGDGPSLKAAAIATRAARADGLVTRGPRDSGTAEIARLVAPSVEAPGASLKDAADKIAAFAKSVPAFGRRGSTPERPADGRRSPRHTVMTTIGGVRIAIEWGQPQMRGRDIWGALVPWNAVWMPGADEATSLTTDGPIALGTFTIPAGDHTLFAMPAADTFQLMISKDVGQFHLVRDLSLIIGRVDMAMAERTGRLEGLTFAIDAAASGQTAIFKLMWDRREYSARLTTK